MIRHLAMISTKKLNIFPTKGDILAYYYPHKILHQISWDYKKHLLYECGSYVQARQVNKQKNKIVYIL